MVLTSNSDSSFRMGSNESLLDVAIDSGVASRMGTPTSPRAVA